MRLKIVLLFLIVLSSCDKAIESDTQVFQTEDLNYANTVLLEAVMEDAFSPPVASRIYSYSHIAHYVTLQSLRQNSLLGITELINDLEDFEAEPLEDVNPELAALLAFSNIGKKLIYSEQFFDQLKDSVLNKAISLKLSATTIKQSDVYAHNISKQLLIR